MVELQATITGKVQGVAYRAFVQEAATELGLVGFVKNVPGGRVEVVAQGLPDTLKEFVEYLYEGSLLSIVDGVAVDWRSASVTYSEFSVLQ